MTAPAWTTPAGLAQLAALAEAATPGPWEATNFSVGGPAFTRGAWEWFSDTGKPNPADAAFIAAARAALPALVRIAQAASGLRWPGATARGECPWCHQPEVTVHVEGHAGCRPVLEHAGDCPWRALQIAFALEALDA